MLSCRFKSVTVPKLGHTEEENEDQFSVPAEPGEKRLRFAIADGATEASFSKEWAALLVKDFQDSTLKPADLLELISRVRPKWKELIDGIAMPWYAEEKATAGAFATFAGIDINCENGTLKAFAAGDCTLFHIRQDNVFDTFPVINSADFGNTPDLLCSISGRGGDESWPRNHSVIISAGDLLILATDAIAAWALHLAEQGEQPWKQLENLLSFEDAQSDFTNWLNQKRRALEIKNDDVTFLLIKLS